MNQLTTMIFLSIVFVMGYGQVNNSVNNTDNYSIIRSNIGTAGSSNTVLFNNIEYNVSQSIEQSSVIGTSSRGGYKLLQGYQQTSLTVHVNSQITNDLKVAIYPNPFDDSFIISFDKLINDEIFVQVFDMVGKRIISKKFPSSQKLNIPLNYISNGVYVLKVSTENKQFISNIIKK